MLLSIILVIYCWSLSFYIDKRFSGRRWSIPSKVFSDSVLVYPGQHLNKDLFLEKLQRLGYRNVSRQPEHKGEFRQGTDILELYLHDLETPTRQRNGFPVKIEFLKNRIRSIRKLENAESVPILEIEPEEVMLFFGPKRERRKLVSIDQVPRHVIYAVLAAEDHRFFRHKGMDVKGILRAVYINLRHTALRQGGSTITQQLAKNYFLTPEKTFSRKLKELFLSVTMEFMYEKTEILEIYLNEIYLGQKGADAVNGLGEAALFYFGKPPEELTLAEGATIAGLIKGPNRYSPYVDENRSKLRRNLVLRAMVQNGWIDRMNLQEALDEPMETAGGESYGKKAPYFMDYLSTQLITLYSSEVLSSNGLSIHTTLDIEVQKAAEKALKNGLIRLEKQIPELNRTDPHRTDTPVKLQGAVIVMQPKTGHILAMVGGRNYGESQFNRAVQAKRQPGSAFKPFVYVSGLDEFTPASLLSNEPKTYDVDGVPWKPRNASYFPQKQVWMKTALANSINLATVDLAMRVGLDRISATGETFGFSTLEKTYPSMALGALDVIPLELARAYCPFAADGVLPYPLSLKEVADENGEILEQRPMTVKRVISPAKAFLMSAMLRNVVQEGTAVSLKKMGILFPVAGKTGTTNNFKDAWFVGYTPDILALVWVGFDDGVSIQASGSRAALPIWAELMNSLPQYVSGEWFRVPPGIVKRLVCSQTGRLAIRNKCLKPVEEFFLEEVAPQDICPLHKTGNPFKQVIDGIKKLIQ